MSSAGPGSAAKGRRHSSENWWILKFKPIAPLPASCALQCRATKQNRVRLFSLLLWSTPLLKDHMSWMSCTTRTCVHQVPRAEIASAAADLRFRSMVGIHVVHPFSMFLCRDTPDGHQTHVQTHVGRSTRTRGTGQQEAGGGSDDNNHQRQSDDSDRDEGEAGGGHFGEGPWLSLCSAVDAPIPEEGASDGRGREIGFGRLSLCG